MAGKNWEMITESGRRLLIVKSTTAQAQLVVAFEQNQIRVRMSTYDKQTNEYSFVNTLEDLFEKYPIFF